MKILKSHNYIQLFSEALERIDKSYISYLMANTKVEQNLFAQIGYQLNFLFQERGLSQLFSAVEYPFKRIDFAIVEKQQGEEDKLLCIFEGKCYYTWDTADRHWDNKWFDRTDPDKPPKNFRECKGAVDKLKRLDQYSRSQKAKKYFILFLEHFNSQVRRNFPYFEYHNDVLADYGHDPTRLIHQSKKFIDTIFPMLGLTLVYYDVQEEFGTYWDTTMGLLTAIGAF